MKTFSYIFKLGERRLEKKSGKHTAKSGHGLLKEVTKSDLFSMLGLTLALCKPTSTPPRSLILSIVSYYMNNST